MRFVHLHVHSEYSLSDGLLRIEDLVSQAAFDGSPAVALTDAGNLFGAVKFYNAAIRNRLKPVIGCELRLLADDENPIEPGHPESEGQALCSVVALCMNRSGYRNLTQLVTRSHLEGQTREGAIVHREWLETMGEGLIILSGGVRGDVGQRLLAGHWDAADRNLRFWKRCFPDRYYLEIFMTERPGEDIYLQRVLPMAEKERIPVVATNDVCFLARKDFDAHEARVCIAQGGHHLNDARRPRHHSQQQYFKSGKEMRELFSQWPQAVQNTEEIARRCTVVLEQGGVSLPDFQLPKDIDEQRYLTDQATQGLRQRLGELADSKLYADRLNEEIQIILDTQYAGYFLIVADFVCWAKNQHIPVGPGRGSGVGSLTAYALGITEIDPVKYGLLFERFLNPERVSPPDFDIDFCMENRDRVIDYVARRYGQDKVCQIITFGRLSARQVIRDVGRIFGHPYADIDSLAKLVPDDLNITLKAAIEKSPDLGLQYKSEEKVKEIINIGMQLEGLVRDPGTHAGGVIIAPKPLVEYTALYRQYREQTVVTQLDMKDIEAIGLVKFDFLGLKTLTMLHLAARMAGERTDREILLEQIQLDDPAVYRFLQSGRTKAIFQLESEGMRSLLVNLQPDCFEDIIALVALYRPGPLEAGMATSYIRRKSGHEKVVYLHPVLEPILHNTFGVIVYQEQVMQIARELSGYTLAAADTLRRAMGKKLRREMAQQKQDFIDGAVKRKVKRRLAEEIFRMVEYFAQYGFNKSHSAAYALISYQTAWFKTHHPAAFMAAAMTVDMGNTDNVVDLAYECNSLGLKIRPPDINSSQMNFTVVDSRNISYGLGAIRTVGKSVAESIVNERENNGAYQSLMDFCVRSTQNRIRKNTIESLLRAGALDSLGESRLTMLQNLDVTCQRAEALVHDQAIGQNSLFQTGEKTQDRVDEIIETPTSGGKHWTKEELLHLKKEMLGFYLDEHPVDSCVEEIDRMLGPQHRLARERDIAAFRGRRAEAPSYRFAGIITATGKRLYKGGTLFSLDDGNHRVVFRLVDEAYRVYKRLLSWKGVVVVEGRKTVDRKRDTSRWHASRIMTLDEVRQKHAKFLSISLNFEGGPDPAERLGELLEAYVCDDGCPVRVRLRLSDIRTELRLGEGWRVRPCGELLGRVREFEPVEDVRWCY